MTDFPGIQKQARGIARLYKWLGLYSIPLLTLVTIISIANVFTRGQLASDPRLQLVWAIVFATSIEVNIVRLFFEAKLDHDRTAKWLGIGLVFVASVALLIEGLQQSIGFDWSNVYAQWTVGGVIALRVIFVLLLLAREGSALASALIDTEPPLYACLVQFDTPIDTVEETALIQQSDAPPVSIRMISSHKDVDTEHKIRAVLKSNPGVSIRTLADKAGVSPGTAQKYKSRIKKEA